MSATFSAETLPNRFDHREARERIYRFWEEGAYFHAEPDAGREPFTIVIPPPNVTGALHLGHALNNTLQDILIRLRRMQGYNALWMPGTDHAGIATQAVVERRLREEEGKTRHDLGREALEARIWAWKDQYESRILSQLKQMGCSCDWQRTRFTLDDICARAVRHTFFDLFRQRKIYRGKRLVNWDTFLQTAVSDDEVFHEAVQGHFWHIRYAVIDPLPGEPAFVTVATTRPETMLGDTAVAVHPDPAAALRAVEEDLLQRLTAAPLKEQEPLRRQLDDVRRRQVEMLPELEQLRDMARSGRKVLLPLLQRPIPLIADVWAKPDLGSGCVKITPAHDPNDYEVGLRQSLPMINILRPDGTLNEHAGVYQGLSIHEARKRVVADLEAEGRLAAVEDREIDLAHSDRSKTPIEPYLADQWFVRMDELAQSAMDAVQSERVRILPPRYTAGYLDWLSEKRDWPVSRQLWWGHRIPVWYARGTESVLQRAFENQPGVTWAPGQAPHEWQICSLEDLSPQALSQAAAIENLEELPPLVQDPDVLDTWFSSALWPHSTLGWPERTPELEHFYPTSVLVTSRDIITLWVARMVLTGLNNVGEVPFREVFIHPKILDGYGETMSKSKGNGVDPLDVIDKFGPDALRFGLAHLCTETQDVRMPVQFECPHCQSLLEQTRENRDRPRITCPKCQQPFSTQWASKPEDRELPRGAVVSERFEVARNFCNKLWNAARFALLNLNGYRAGNVADAELAVEDRWLLSRLETVTQQATEALESYRFAEAVRTLYDFAWDEFCSFYVEMAKGRLQDETRRVVAQRVLAYALEKLLRLLHPIIPFITEEIWQLLREVAPERGLSDPEPSTDSIMIAPWPQADEARRDPAIEAQFARFQSALSAIRDLRLRQGIAAKNPLEFSVRCDPQVAAQLQPLESYFKSMANAQPRAYGPDVAPPAVHARLSLGDLELFVDLQAFIDVDAELQRNRAQRDKLAGLIQGKRAKLDNASFVQRAPPDVVRKEREALAQFEEQLRAVEVVLADLQRLQDPPRPDA